MALERSAERKLRVHPRDIYKERVENDEANARIEKLLFEYILKNKKRLQDWLDQGKPED